MTKLKRRGILTGFLLALFVLAALCRPIDYLAITDLGKPLEYTVAPELTENLQYVQRMSCLVDNTKRIGLQFANYGNRDNSGTVSIRIVSSDGQHASRELDAARISDGGYEYVQLDRPLAAGTLLEIQVSSDSQPGEAVTIFGTVNPTLDQTGALFTVNGQPQPIQLNVTFGYRSPALSPWFSVLFGLCCLLLLATGVPQYYYRVWQESGRARRVALYLILLLVGTVIFTLRNLQFIRTPILYGEDGAFLARQLEQGLLQTLFATRGGGTHDFPNTGTYLLLWLAGKTTMLLNGYSLAEFPLWMGIYSNLYLAAVATLAYRVFELLGGKRMGIAAYFTVVFVNLGNSSAEVLGRSLNTQFVWVVTVALLLMLQYQKDLLFGVESLCVSGLCLVGAFTFPVCFLEIGIYLAAVGWRTLRDREWKRRMGGNAILAAILAVGAYLLPQMMAVEGLGALYAFKADSAIEFFLARHILYPFVSLFYSSLNDKITVLLFLLYMAVVLTAAVFQVRQSGQLCNCYTLFAALALGVCFSSAFMRRTLTQLFDHYMWTYPDRYFYGCNILSMLLLCFALWVILTYFHMPRRVGTLLCASMILLLNADPHLFYFTNENYSVLYGERFTGAFAQSCASALDQPERVNFDGTVVVNLYPYGWKVPFPIQYVAATAKDCPDWQGG